MALKNCSNLTNSCLTREPSCDMIVIKKTAQDLGELNILLPKKYLLATGLFCVSLALLFHYTFCHLQITIDKH